jgi:hypothetical protein
MAFANSSISDIIATTIQSRSRKIADNVTANNAGLSRLKTKGKIKTVSGGEYIMQELSFAENANTGWYSGYDLLPVAASDVISGAQFNWKQAAVPVVISGLEMLKNSGKERIIDLMQARLEVAESSMANLLSDGFYSDGTGSGAKEIDGLAAVCPLDPTAASYAGIDGNVYAFWKNQVENIANYSTIQADWLALWSKCSRGADRTDLILASSGAFNAYVASLQAQHRFTGSTTVDAGFQSIKFMDADVVLDGGIYPSGSVTGAAGVTTGRAYFLNTDYIFLRPHKDRNMVPLSPNKRYATNQDAEVQILAWAGNLTCSGRQFQGVFDGV